MSCGAPRASCGARAGGSLSGCRGGCGVVLCGGREEEEEVRLFSKAAPKKEKEKELSRRRLEEPPIVFCFNGMLARSLSRIHTKLLLPLYEDRRRQRAQGRALAQAGKSAIKQSAFASLKRLASIGVVGRRRRLCFLKKKLFTYRNSESLSCSFFRAWFRVMYCAALPVLPCVNRWGVEGEGERERE